MGFFENDSQTYIHHLAAGPRVEDAMLLVHNAVREAFRQMGPRPRRSSAALSEYEPDRRGNITQRGKRLVPLLEYAEKEGIIIQGVRFRLWRGSEYAPKVQAKCQVGMSEARDIILEVQSTRPGQSAHVVKQVENALRRWDGTPPPRRRGFGAWWHEHRHENLFQILMGLGLALLGYLLGLATPTP